MTCTEPTVGDWEVFNGRDPVRGWGFVVARRVRHGDVTVWQHMVDDAGHRLWFSSGGDARVAVRNAPRGGA